MASEALDESGEAQAARDAESRDAESGVACLESVQQADEKAGAGAADGMPQRNGASIGVDLLGVEWQFLEAGEDLAGEGLVELDLLDVSVIERVAIERCWTSKVTAAKSKMSGNSATIWVVWPGMSPVAPSRPTVVVSASPSSSKRVTATVMPMATSTP